MPRARVRAGRGESRLSGRSRETFLATVALGADEVVSPDALEEMARRARGLPVTLDFDRSRTIGYVTSARSDAVGLHVGFELDAVPEGFAPGAEFGFSLPSEED